MFYELVHHASLIRSLAKSQQSGNILNPMNFLPVWMAQTPVCPEPTNMSMMWLHVMLEYASIFSTKRLVVWQASWSVHASTCAVWPIHPLAGVVKWTPVFCFILVKLWIWIKPSFFVVLARVNYGVMWRDKPARCNCTKLVFPFNVVGFMLLCLVQGITHITHFFLSVPIPIFHIFSSSCGLFLINRKMQSSSSARGTRTQRLGLPHSS